MAMTAEILTSSPLIDADAIERDIGTVINSRRAPVIRPAPQLPVDELLPQGPMPDYVVHRDGVNRVGKLSAEAVVREYDAVHGAPNAKIVSIPGIGHAVAPQSPCAQTVIVSFLADPAAPDTSCVGTLRPPTFTPF